MTAVQSEVVEQSPARLTRGALIRLRFLRNRLAVLGLVILVMMFLLAFVGPFFSKYRWD